MDSVGRFLQTFGSSFFLFGPRGTGKSTWLRASQQGALWIDLLDPEAQRAYLARPERLREVVAGRPEARVVVIDEIQKVPGLLDVVHALVESGAGLQFVLTGSSARKLRRGAANLLAGRLLEAHMHPFMAAELGAGFDLARAMQIGLVPLVWQAADPVATLRAYAALYLREEVQAEALVRDIGSFARFLEAISFSQGSLLNLAEVARDCQVGRKAVEGYLGVLEDLLLAFRVPVFSKRAKRILVTHEKFYYFDAGVFRSLRPAGPLDRPAEIAGLVLESLIAQHLRAWCDYRADGTQMYFWRTKSGSEVDFIVYGPAVFWAIEVKHADRVDSKDLRALRAFREDYPEAQACLLTMGAERRLVDGVLCLPAAEFLRALHSARVGWE